MGVCMCVCIIIIMINGHVTVYHYNDKVTLRSLNVNISYILRCFCLRDIRLIVSIFIVYSLKLLISAILQ